MFTQELRCVTIYIRFNPPILQLSFFPAAATAAALEAALIRTLSFISFHLSSLLSIYLLVFSSHSILPSHFSRIEVISLFLSLCYLVHACKSLSLFRQSAIRVLICLHNDRNRAKAGFISLTMSTFILIRLLCDYWT